VVWENKEVRNPIGEPGIDKGVQKEYPKRIYPLDGI